MTIIDKVPVKSENGDLHCKIYVRTIDSVVFFVVDIGLNRNFNIGSKVTRDIIDKYSIKDKLRYLDIRVVDTKGNTLRFEDNNWIMYEIEEFLSELRLGTYISSKRYKVVISESVDGVILSIKYGRDLDKEVATRFKLVSGVTFKPCVKIKNHLTHVGSEIHRLCTELLNNGYEVNKLSIGIINDYITYVDIAVDN